MSLEEFESVAGWPRVAGVDRTQTKTPVLWTPTQRNTRLWLDFADVSRMTLVSNALSTVIDKSGNSITYTQPTTAARPNYIASSTGGLPAIDFVAGANMFMDSTTSVQTNNNGAMTFLFFGSSRAAGNCMFTERSTTLVQSFQFVSAAVMSDGANGSSNHATSFTFPTGDFIAVFEHVPTQRGKLWVNGSPVTLTSGTCSAITGAAGSRLGRREASVGGSWNGLMYEVAVELLVMPDSIRQFYEGYFAWRRSIPSILPTNHPYRFSAPVT